ncbi:MAG: penicillin-binding protein activator [Pseudohongiellaceae bacterium]
MYSMCDMKVILTNRLCRPALPVRWRDGWGGLRWVILHALLGAVLVGCGGTDGGGGAGGVGSQSGRPLDVGAVDELVAAADRDSVDYYLLRAEAELATGAAGAAVATLLQAAQRFPNQADRLRDTLWRTLELCDAAQLDALADSASDYEMRGWVELARISRSSQFSLRSQLNAIARWRRVWAQHSAADRPPAALARLEQAWEQRPRHVALILPLQGAAGKAIQEGFLSAYYQSLANSRDVARISVFDSSGLSSIADMYDEAVDSGADLIIGPLDKALVNQLKQSRNLEVTTLALNYADDTSTLTNRLYQFGLTPEDEIAQAVDLAWDAGHRNAALLTPALDDYARLRNIFTTAWTARGGTVVADADYHANSDYATVVKRLLAIDSSESRRDRLVNILPRSEVRFTPHRRSDIDFLFLIANPRQGRQIKPTLGFYFAENMPVYSMPSIYDGTDNPAANQDLNGIVFTDAPWVFDSDSTLKATTQSTLPPAQGALQRLRAMGVDSFQLHLHLAQLAAGDVNTLHGATGVLTLDENNHIRRRLQVARFENGKAHAQPTTLLP